MLLTGVNGFVGRHLAALLAEDSRFELYGLCRSPEGGEGMARLLDEDRISVGSITDAAAVAGAVTMARPDYIFHLAAQSFVPLSFEDPQSTMDTNVRGTVNLLEAVRSLSPDARILICGTGEEYGRVEAADLPVSEEAPLRPGNPYAVSKVAQDMLGYQYAVSHGLQIIRTRAFNHTGPGQTDRFVCSGFARRIAEVARGLRPPLISTGNLAAARDFTDVRDVVRAYLLLLEKGIPGEVYNVCSGRVVVIEEILRELLDLAGVEAEVATDEQLFRPLDMPVLYGSHRKCTELTGWQPVIPLRDTLRDLLDYWMGRV